MIVTKGAATSVPVFEQLQILHKMVRYWKLQDRAGRLMLRVDPHVALRVLGVLKIVMEPRGGGCWGSVVSDRAEWYARSDRSVIEAKVWNVDLKYREVDCFREFTLRHWIERKPYFLAKMLLERGETYMGVFSYCSKYNVEPWADTMWWFHIKLPKIDLGQLDFLLKECAAYIRWVDMEHSKAMSVVSRGRIAVEIAQAFCKGHHSQAVQLALALNTVEIMWKSPFVAAGLHRDLRKERQQERLVFRFSSFD